MRTKLTYKQEAFSRAYIKNKMNGVKTAKEVYNPTTYGSAHAIASENIQKPAVKKRIDELLNEILPEDKALSILNRNITQEKNIPASNQALDMAFKIKGAYAPEKKLTVSLTVNQVLEREKLLLEELRLLDSHSDA